MNDFNVLDMLDDYAAEEGMDPAEVFKKHPVSGNVKAEAEAQQEAKKPVKKANGIDPTLIEGMEEFNQPGAVYNKDEIRVGEEPLKNIIDEDAITESKDSLSDLKRKEANIEEAKARHNIKYLHIPEGEMQVKMLIAAADTNHTRAQERLDIVLDEIEKIYPEMIEFNESQENKSSEIDLIVDNPDDQPAMIDTAPVINEDDIVDEEPNEIGDSLQVVINKQDLPDVTWTKEDVDKIKRARTIELNIVDAADIDFGSITDADDIIDDTILDQYVRKTNDVIGVLPASKYRATFTGLTYPEILDLENSEEVNNLDGERKKWSICFKHMKNQSIGPWEEYILYKDPTTGREVKDAVNAKLPEGVNDTDVHYVSKFEDFLRKTSYIDLEFMLWKVLCATTMDQEVVSITCKAKVNGKECGHTYDWIYSPADLLERESITPTVLEEMKETGEARSTEEILRVYKTSPVNSNDYVSLHVSGFVVVYGHISAYDYLEDVYPKLKEIEENRNEEDPELASEIISSMVLTTIKAVLLPTGDGKFIRVRGANNIVKVLQRLDEVDWMTIVEINNLMLRPYSFRFSVRGLVCPKCKNRSEIPITSMQELIFIVARSLNSVQVTLRRG